MDKLALLLALGALGVAVWWGPLDQGRTHDSAVAPVDDASDLREEVATLRRELESLRGGQQTLGPSPVPGGTPALLGQGQQRPAASGVSAPRAQPASVAERLAAIEAWRTEEEERRSKPVTWATESGGPVVFGGNHKVIGSPDQATKALSLSAGQQAELKETLDELKAEMQRLQDIPNEEGETLRELNERFDAKLKEAQDGGTFDPSVVFEQLGATSKFMRGKIPGRSETYAEAETRLRKEAKSRIRNGLDSAQRETWDKSMTEPLFPSSGPLGATGSVVMSVGGMDEDDG